MNVIITSLFLFGLCGPADCSEPSPFFTLQAKKDDKKDKEKKRKLGFTVGKDTTYVTGPLDKDGFIDYEAALNERLREGVTPENNANVLLFKAFGPHPDGAKIPDDFFKWMKIPAPPEKGDYFAGPGKLLKEKFKGDDTSELTKQIYDFQDLLDKLQSRPWSAKEHPDVAEWLKRNEKPLAVVIEASKRSRYYYPLVAREPDGKQGLLIGALVPGVQKMREFVQALAVRAMLRVHEQKYDEAWQDLLACHRLGRLVGQGGGTLIEGLVGIALDHIASQADLAFLDGAKLDAKRAKNCLRDLQALPPMPMMAEKVALAERFIFLQAIMMIDRDGVDSLDGLAGPKPFRLPARKDGPIFVWDTSLRKGNQFYARMSVAMRLKDRALRDKHLVQIERDVIDLRANVIGPWNLTKSVFAAKDLREATSNATGDILISLLCPAVRKVQDAADRTEQTQNNGHVAFALAAYRSENGKYPKTLDPLAPKYLATIPQDLFSGKALIYRPSENGYLLYSVGVNGRDDDGRSHDDDPSGDDLPVRMPLPKLREKQ